MDTLTAIETRRSVKQFDPGYRIDAETERALLAAAMRSPTAFNIQHWRFVVVRDPALRRAIRDVGWMQPQITDASLLIVLAADVAAWTKAPERYWSDAPEDVRTFITEAIAEHYDGHPRRQRDEAMRSCGIAAQTLMLAATAMGLDTCPMDLADFDKVGEVIGLPDDHVIGLMLAIGKRTRAPWPRSGQLARAEVVVENRFAP
jgi:nitroreductase